MGAHGILQGLRPREVDEGCDGRADLEQAGADDLVSDDELVAPGLGPRQRLDQRVLVVSDLEAPVLHPDDGLGSVGLLEQLDEAAPDVPVPLLHQQVGLPVEEGGQEGQVAERLFDGRLDLGPVRTGRGRRERQRRVESVTVEHQGAPPEAAGGHGAGPFRHDVEAEAARREGVEDPGDPRQRAGQHGRRDLRQPLGPRAPQLVESLVLDGHDQIEVR